MLFLFVLKDDIAVRQTKCIEVVQLPIAVRVYLSHDDIVVVYHPLTTETYAAHLPVGLGKGYDVLDLSRHHSCSCAACYHLGRMVLQCHVHELHKAYLQLPTTTLANATTVTLIWDEITAIDNLSISQFDKKADVWYDLQGHKIVKSSNGQMPKGIVIMNGKKTVRK